MSVLIPLVDALSKALSTQDEAGFEALCSAAGWAAKGDGAKRLWSQGSRRQWSLVTTGAPPRGAEGRGAIAVEVHAPERGRVSIVHLLFVDDDGAWKLEGVTGSLPVVDAFIALQVPALFSLDALPAHAGLESWAQHAASSDLKGSFGGARDAAPILERACAPGITPTLLESRYLDTVGSGLVVFEMTEAGNEFPERFTIVADEGPEGWTPRTVGTYPSAEMLLPAATRAA